MLLNVEEIDISGFVKKAKGNKVSKSLLYMAVLLYVERVKHSTNLQKQNIVVHKDTIIVLITCKKIRLHS